jgi:hypothetical protein
MVKDMRESMPQPPFFSKNKDGSANILLNGIKVDKEWFRECRDALNFFLENYGDEDIKKINNEIEEENLKIIKQSYEN